MSSPVVTVEDVTAIMATLYNLQNADILSLGSCQDANFKIKMNKSVTSSNGIKSDTFVFKVSHLCYAIEEITYQNTVLEYTNKSKMLQHLSFPQCISLYDDATNTIGKATINSIEYYVRLFTYVKGPLLSDSHYLSSNSLYNVGSFVALTHNAFEGYAGYSIERLSEWDMKHAMNNIEINIAIVSSSSNKEETAMLQSLSQQMYDMIHPCIDKFQTHLIHGDLAHYNIIACDSDNGRPIVHGVIDFGDVVSSWLVGDIAATIFPLLVREDSDCLSIALDVMRGYVSTHNLSYEEAICIWPLVILRAILVYIRVYSQLIQDGENDYCKEETVLNKAILTRVFNVPVYAAVKAMTLVCCCDKASIYVGISANRNTSTIDTMMGNESISVFNELDLTCTSPIYHQDNWLNRDCIEDCIVSIVTNNMAKPCKHTVIPYGKPNFYLTSCVRQIATSSATIPLGTTIFISGHCAIHAPHTCTVILIGNDAVVLISKSDEVAYDVLLEGISIDYDAAKVYAAGDIVGYVLPSQHRGSSSSYGKIWIQTIPKGLIVADVISDISSSDICNNAKCYDSRYLPPKYCHKDNAFYWKHLCKDIFADDADVATTDSGCSVALANRYNSYAEVQQHYYTVPPIIERGYKQFLYDIYGRGYLDMVNNVAIVGHSHGGVIAAAHKQMNILNTNSRFIYEALGKYTERIVGMVPTHLKHKLNTVFLVNSGSEATDLAMRIARAVVTERRRKNRKISSICSSSDDHTSAYSLNRDTICLIGGYHGVTTSSDEVSTTLNDNPRSLDTRAPWIHLVPMPNLYRGLYALHEGDSVVDVSNRYAKHVDDKIGELKSLNKLPAVFICEPLSGNAGGVEIPEGYLSKVYDSIHKIGGLCIADEVQVGYGRLGNHFWGFIEHGVEPDIITMAKAAGNGHPLGYVITSKEIAAEFGAEGSFFSSAGGGPVSCAIGLAVLDAVIDEGLQENALVVGKYMNERLNELCKRYPDIVGCIHGHGLYQGIELIQKGDRHRPATKEAYAICERLLELGVITHNTGDYSNVLKVKPPLVFSIDDVDFFIKCLDITFKYGW